MAELTQEQLKNILKNRTAFAKMNLEQRLEMRRTMKDALRLPFPLAPSESEKLELSATIDMLDSLMLQKQYDSRKRQGENQK